MNKRPSWKSSLDTPEEVQELFHIIDNPLLDGAERPVVEWDGRQTEIILRALIYYRKKLIGDQDSALQITFPNTQRKE